MPSIVHGFDWPDRLVVGTIGRPGERAFYLQARSGKRVTSVGRVDNCMSCHTTAPHGRLFGLPGDDW